MAAVAGLGASVSRVVVTHVTEGTFHARVYLETAAGDETDVDSRTSDAIAVAVRTGSPISPIGCCRVASLNSGT